MQFLFATAKGVSNKLATAVHNQAQRRRLAKQWTGPFLSFRESPAPWPEELKRTVERDFTVIPNFITVEQHENLLDEIEATLKKRRYQPDHFDKVISGYKETEKSIWVRTKAVQVENHFFFCFGFFTLIFDEPDVAYTAFSHLRIRRIRRL